MRMAAYVMILALTLLMPVERLDIAKLQPVEAVAVYKEKGMIVLKTDKESVGKGVTAQQALENLKENTPAVVYLDTADYLLIGEGAENTANLIQSWLKPSVKTAKYLGGSVKEETEYLKVHGSQEKPN